MQAWTDGDLEMEFEQRLDGLLAELCPGWQPPALPDVEVTTRYRDYERRCAKRLRLKDQLTAQPDAAVQFADRILTAIVCDGTSRSTNS